VAEATYYDGDVCYQDDGWHYTAIDHPGGVGNGEPGHVYQVPGERLVLEDTADGTASRYRLATDADTKSWHDRKHGQFVGIAFEDGTPGVTVTAEEMQAIQEFLDQRRAGQ
jgi:hypothetical protein